MPETDSLAIFRFRFQALLSDSYFPGNQREPLREQTLGQMLEEATASAPDTTALVEGSPDPARRRRWTYTELLDESRRMATRLLRDFTPGEQVAIWAHNVPEWEIVQFACAFAGLTLVTVNPAYGRAELSYALSRSRSAGVIAVATFRDRDMLAEIDAVRPELPELRVVHEIDTLHAEALTVEPDPAAFPEVKPTDPAIMQYTSGTTGFAKAAVLSHRGLVNNGYLLAERMGANQGCVWLSPMPMFHVGGCEVAALGAIGLGGTHVLMTWDARLALELIETERATVMGAVPTMLLAMREHPDFATRDLASVQTILSGGTPVAPSVVTMVESDFDARFVMIFGQTETSGVICESKPDDTVADKSETVGQPLPHTDVKVADLTTGKPRPCDEVGEIMVRGFGNMIEYFGQPDETAATIEPDGWLHTGDLGTMDDRGYLKVTGRLKDMVIRGGENLFPREIEDALLRHPDVADAAVIGVPDARYGEELCAYVRAAGETTPPTTALAEFLGEHLAHHKVPRHWRFIDALPLTPSGKIQKFVLRDLFAAEPSPDTVQA
jgi:fatty-acyl-CoA synthase